MVLTQRELDCRSVFRARILVVYSFVRASRQRWCAPTQGVD